MRSMVRKLFRVLFLVPLFAAGCFHSGPKPEVTIVNAMFTDVNLFETGMQFTVKVTNHTPEPLIIDGAVYHIYLNDIDVGTGSSGELLEVPRFGSANQIVKVGLSNLSMISNIRDIVESQKFKYEIESEFYMKGHSFPLMRGAQYPLPHAMSCHSPPSPVAGCMNLVSPST